MSKAQNKAAAGMLAGLDAGHAQHAIDARLAVEAHRGRTIALVDAYAIHPRENDSRQANAAHVLSLAESIAAVGLVQALALDRNHRLVAGLHRWNACRLLMADRNARRELLAVLDGADKVEELDARLAKLPTVGNLPEPLKGGVIPCRVLAELDAAKDPDAALAAEAAENTARKQYTPAEVAALAARLRKAGYRETGGRPGKGEKALRPALEMVLGVSASTARRLLGKKDARPKGGHVATFSDALARVAKALDVLALPEMPAGTRAPALRKALDAAKNLDALLADAITEAKTLESDR